MLEVTQSKNSHRANIISLEDDIMFSLRECSSCGAPFSPRDSETIDSLGVRSNISCNSCGTSRKYRYLSDQNKILLSRGLIRFS